MLGNSFPVEGEFFPAERHWMQIASTPPCVPGEPKKIPPTTFVDITAMHGNFCTKFYTIVKRSNIHFITKFY